MRTFKGALAAVMILGAAGLVIACQDRSEQPSFEQTADRMTAYLGVVPAAIVRAHPSEHVEGSMHPSQPRGNAHMLIALYDSVSGARIEDASIEAVISGERHSDGYEARLEPMQVEGVVTYGAFITVAEDERYHIALSIRRGATAHATHMRFLFDASGLAAAAPS